jgi:magnesium chelatase subunit D
VDGCRFGCDPSAPDRECPDGPHAAGARSRERPAHLVELPVGATEDRVIGSLHLAKALSDGITEYEPGLLAEAHRGLLYVDEVNLLHDHLVDLLLDAAAMGRCTVERDGVSVAHAARFVLVGTMNPEEGDLRPQLLDRFGLSVEVAAPRDLADRTEVVRRRLAFEADPAGFAARYATAEQQLSERIVKAQAALPGVTLGDDALTKIAQVCAAFEVDGLRADIVTARAALAHAAWMGRTHVTRADIRAAARLAVPHRRRRSPFDAPGIDEDLLDEILGDDDTPPDGSPDDDPDGTPPPDGASPRDDDPDGDRTGPEPERDAPDGDDPDRGDRDPAGQHPGADGPDEETDGRPSDQRADGPTATTVVAPQQAYRARVFTVAGSGAGEVGRRSRARTARGRTVGSRPVGAAVDGAAGALHLTATVRSAAAHQLARGRDGGRLLLRPDDVRLKVTEGQESNLVLLCVDASGSMAARRRMEQVKTAVLSLLLDAYQRRDKVGLVTFRGHDATLVLPPTGSVELAAARLRELPAGGRTPLSEGLARAAETLRVERLKDPRRRPLLVVLTDGRANSGPDALARSLRAADHLRAQRVASVVIDCETGRFRMGLAARLADRLCAEHVPVGEVSADAITSTVRRRAA